MPILGGNRHHKWSYKGNIDELDTDNVHKNYLKSNDIAGQLVNHDKKSKLEVKYSFVEQFYNKILSLFQ